MEHVALGKALVAKCAFMAAAAAVAVEAMCFASGNLYPVGLFMEGRVSLYNTIIRADCYLLAVFLLSRASPFAARLGRMESIGPNHFTKVYCLLFFIPWAVAYAKFGCAGTSPLSLILAMYSYMVFKHSNSSSASSAAAATAGGGSAAALLSSPSKDKNANARTSDRSPSVKDAKDAARKEQQRRIAERIKKMQ